MQVRRCKYRGCHTLVTQPNQYCQNHSNLKSSRSEYNRVYNATVRQKANKLEQYRFYRSRIWKSLRAGVLERDMYLCQYCKAQGRVKPGNIVDHIIPIEYDASLRADITNLATTCKECHNAKTKWEHEYYGTGLENEKKEVAKLTNLELLSKLIESHKKPVERF